MQMGLRWKYESARCARHVERHLYWRCTATCEGQQEVVKLNLWDSDHVLRGGPTAQSLTGLEIEGEIFSRLTAGFTGGPLPSADSPGLLMRAAALANAPGSQINRCTIDAPTSEEQR